MNSLDDLTLVEWERTQLTLGRPVDAPALLDALESAVADRDHYDREAERLDEYAETLEAALAGLAKAATASGLPALVAAAEKALAAIPPERRGAVEEDDGDGDADDDEDEADEDGDVTPDPAT